MSVESSTSMSVSNVNAEFRIWLFGGHLRAADPFSVGRKVVLYHVRQRSKMATPLC